MTRSTAIFLMYVVTFFLLGPPLDAQDKEKKIKNIFYGKIVEVDKDKVVVVFDKDWNNEKLDRKHTFSGDSFKILILTATKDPMTKEEVKDSIANTKGKVVPAEDAAKVLSAGMKLMCPIYNGGPPEKDGTIVVSGKKKKKVDGN